LRTELGKLPGSDSWHADMLGLLPVRGAGLALEDLRGCDLAAVKTRVAAVAQGLAAAAARLSDLIGQRYFAHAGIEATHSV